MSLQSAGKAPEMDPHPGAGYNIPLTAPDISGPTETWKSFLVIQRRESAGKASKMDPRPGAGYNLPLTAPNISELT